ncbi:MAG: guanylate kinase [Chlamydiales bacterium]|nr:guanylate kinase [Chlamydiales bacterium]
MSNSHKVLGNHSHGLLFVVSAPAGTGKTTLVEKLTHEFPCVVRSISSTTRPKRPTETDGVDYCFLTDEEFEKKVAEGQFLEHVTLFGYQYGTSKHQVEKQRAAGHHVVLVIDTQGALHLMGQLAATFIFILPPSFEELARRLQERGTENYDSLSKRLHEAEREIATSTAYQYVIVNDEIQTAYEVLKSIVIAEEHRIR